MRATQHVTPSAANPCFAPAGSSAQFFVVSEGISTDDALEGASMFLSAVADLGAGVEDGSRWAISCLAEIAKALIDTVIEARIPSSDRGADHGEGARRPPSPIPASPSTRPSTTSPPAPPLSTSANCWKSS